METAISKAIDINKQAIETWIMSNPKAGVPKAFEADPGMGNLGRGYEVLTNGGPIVDIAMPMPKVNVVLIPDGKGGYLIHTAHPIK